MKKNMHAKTLAIVLATTTALQMTGITSQILNGVPFVTANAVEAMPSRVSISGTERVGKTLEAKMYLPNNTLFTTSAGVTYNWYRLNDDDDNYLTQGTHLSENDKDYKLVSSDKDDYIRVVVNYNGMTFTDITSDIDKRSSSSSDDDDDDDDYELSSLELLNSNNETIKLYDDDDYEDRVDEDDVDSGDTYYAKTSSNSIHIDASGVDDDNIKVFKGTADSTKGKDADDAISISGDTTIVVRTYDEDVSDETVKYDDDDYDYEEEYTIKIKYTGSGTTATNTTTTDNTTINNTAIPSIGFQTASNGTKKIIENGRFVTGWKVVGGCWYLADSTGTVLTGWQFVNGRWYLLNSSGAMVTGWQFTNGRWYLLSSSGAMVTGWQFTNGKWYYLYSNGAMASNTIINGYRLDTTGAWIR